MRFKKGFILSVKFAFWTLLNTSDVSWIVILAWWFTLNSFLRSHHVHTENTWRGPWISLNLSRNVHNYWCTLLIWVFKYVLLVVVNSQLSHKWVLSKLWTVFMWNFKFDLESDTQSHFLHFQFLIPSWILSIWRLSCVPDEVAKSHLSHRLFFSAWW